LWQHASELTSKWHKVFLRCSAKTGQQSGR
jgi:hypothetical protein